MLQYHGLPFHQDPPSKFPNSEVIEKHLASGVRVGCLSPRDKALPPPGFSGCTLSTPADQHHHPRQAALLLPCPRPQNRVCFLLAAPHKVQESHVCPCTGSRKVLTIHKQKKIEKAESDNFVFKEWVEALLHSKKTSENFVLSYDYIKTIQWKWILCFSTCSVIAIMQWEGIQIVVVKGLLVSLPDQASIWKVRYPTQNKFCIKFFM